jgi:hypothetical protein
VVRAPVVTAREVPTFPCTFLNRNGAAGGAEQPLRLFQARVFTVPIGGCSDGYLAVLGVSWYC